MKYLTLIQAVALLHQYQRDVKTVTHRGTVIEYIEVAESDITLANQLVHEVLGRTLDEMPPQTRKLLLLIQSMVNERAKQEGCLANEVRFTRRDIRNYTHWSDSQLKNHCQRLSDMEYLLIHGGSRGHLLHYELLWDGHSPHENHLCGLLNTTANESDVRKSGLLESKSAPGLAHVRVKSEPSKQVQMQSPQSLGESQIWGEENAVINAKNKNGALPSPSVNHPESGA